MTSDRPIFVVGCPRSGTTLLQLMLHAHPRIAIPPETRFLLTAYQRRRDFGDLRDPGRRRALADWITGREETRFVDLGLDRKQVTDEIVAGPPTLGSALGIVFRAYAGRFGKPRWGDKRPAYVNNLDIVLRLFPDAQIVNIVRDGRDCVASLKEMPWHKADIYHSISAWAQAVDHARRARRRLGPGSFYHLRYEELVHDPVGELAALCDFLGEEYDEAMTRPADVAPVAVPREKTWHARTHVDVNDDRVGSWAERLEPWELALCESVLGDRLRAEGYEASGGGRPGIRQLMRYAPIGARHRLAPLRRGARRVAGRLRPAEPVAARLTSAQLRLPTSGHAEPALRGEG
jgi:Sulfotransferase family